MTTTREDKAYCEFVKEIAEKHLAQFSEQELEEFLSDVTGKINSMIDEEREAKLYRDAADDERDRMQMLKEEMEEEPMENDSEDTMDI